ncbi:hypothetical protein BDB00DRAFT_810124 [Zychaea mexicana]|uniref:uncharacterized protein n=1 Tax=Zychaea mexicana TaxID=64656 RepID=UPI0022FE828A|nr:uncharacterized protein BDB00DRAFT_810124 [Zychaea mexicana]KAI9496357.1 hypothetical protein BDB00DRAFT_810124 [Zychaea mexicana]
MTLETMDIESLPPDDHNVKRFKSLQYRYLTVYLVVMGADWLQGPYLYKLYQSYGFDLVQIAFLFLTGFVSGAIGGTAAGSMADSWGRRRGCFLFCATSCLSLFLRVFSSNYPLLFVSHVLSGMAASMQYSVFEAWYVAEHTTQNLPGEWMARTFGKGTFLNGLVAIVAGIVANAVVDLWGYTAPFVVSMALVVLAAGTISSTWAENYGESSSGQIQLMRTLKEGLQALLRDSNILVLGAAQTVFECAMYIFVLLYTPAIEKTAAVYVGTDEKSQELPLGYLFSTMMFAVMMGSLTFQTLERQSSSSSAWRLASWCTKDRLLVLALGLASTSFGAMMYDEATSLPILVVAYHVFEFSTGLYYPSLSSLKAEAIPEETRAAVMTLLRIPMNVGVGIIMWHVDDLSTPMLFAICSLMTMVGAALMTIKFRPKIPQQQ